MQSISQKVKTTASAAKQRDLFLIMIFVMSFFFITLCMNIYSRSQEEYAMLATSFLKGQLYLETPRADSTLYKGHYYWHMGPFPAVLLMPFMFAWSLISNEPFRQGFLQIILTGIIFYLCYWLSKRNGYARTDSLYLAFAFCFASVYQYTAFMPWVWYFVQVVSALLLFLSIYEYYNKQRYWLIGIYLAMVLMSRYTAVLCVLFFVIALIDKYRRNYKELVFKLAQLFVPILLAGALLLLYNFVRFENPFNNGYVDSNAWLYTDAERFEQINYGLFQLRNIPTNIYYYFINGVRPVVVNFQSIMGNTFILRPPYIRVNYPGTSFFVVSPIFLYIFLVNFKKNKDALYALVPVISIMFLLLTYYWPGWRQIGPRYTLDFLPFLYLILLYAFKGNKLTRLAKFTILISSLFNLYLFLTFF